MATIEPPKSSKTIPGQHLVGSDSEKFGLGNMYSTGDSLPKDYVAAYMWLNLAAAKGWRDAAEGRESVAKLMTPSQIDQAQALSAAWKPKTAGSP